MGVISIRLSNEMEDTLRKHAIDPPLFAKQILEAKARAIRAREAETRLAMLRRPSSRSTTSLLREDRDAR